MGIMTLRERTTVKIKLKKYIVDFSATSFAYILPTEISQYIIDTYTIHTKIKLS